ncbi:MAG TPA: substrate-binding domain-containing protein [Gemmatimonadaceae bacterium]
MHLRRVALSLAAVVAAAGCRDSRRPSADASGRGSLTIAVIPKGTSHEYWKSIHAGAVKAARELTAQGTPVTLVWKGPLREDDREQQVQVVESFLSQGVQGIVLAPLDRTALARPVEEAKAAGIPTLIIDSALESDAIVSFVATDNRRGGALAADRLGSLLGGHGRVAMLRYQEGSASTTEREEGFLAEMRSKYPQVEIVSADQYSGPTRDTAKRASENLLDRFRDRIDGVFTPNESATVGMLLALQDAGRAGKIRFVGFDAGETLLAALHAGQLDGLAVQNPMRMGYLGVRTLVEHLQGKPVQSRVETGVTLVTKENVDDPAIAEIVNPPLATYLDGQ